MYRLHPSIVKLKESRDELTWTFLQGNDVYCHQGRLPEVECRAYNVCAGSFRPISDELEKVKAMGYHLYATYVLGRKEDRVTDPYHGFYTTQLPAKEGSVLLENARFTFDVPFLARSEVLSYALTRIIEGNVDEAQLLQRLRKFEKRGPNLHLQYLKALRRGHGAGWVFEETPFQTLEDVLTFLNTQLVMG